jgi:hypothetical protein
MPLVLPMAKIDVTIDQNHSTMMVLHLAARVKINFVHLHAAGRRFEPQ